MDNGFLRHEGHGGGGDPHDRLRRHQGIARPWTRLKPANDNRPPPFWGRVRLAIYVSTAALLAGLWVWGRGL